MGTAVEWRPSGAGLALCAASDGWRTFFREATRRLRREPVRRLDRLCLNVLLGLDRRLIESAQNAPLLVTMRSAGGAAFCYPFGDLYWTRSGFRTGRFEPELLAFFAEAKSIDYVFIDCGANFGLWSAVATSPAVGVRAAVAIEASPVSFRVLRRTRRLNGDRFVALHNAISSKDDEVLEFSHSLSHAASHVVGGDGDAGPGRRVRVTTITIDSIIDRFAGDEQPVVVKLDVEGQELAALEGGLELLKRPSMLFYEDHGADADSRVTASLLSRGWTTFWPVSSDGSLRLLEIKSAADLRPLKVNPHFGYNLFALPPLQDGVWRQLVDRALTGRDERPA